MKKQLFTFWLGIFFAFSVTAFSQKAEKIDEFNRYIQCGEFMARMDSIFQYWKNAGEPNIYVVYYGTKFRVSTYFDKKTKREYTKLDYPHQEDAIAKAKAIPLYLTTMSDYSETDKNKLKDKIFLIDGGFQDKIQFEIWTAPKTEDIPKTESLFDKKDVIFKAKKPFATPNYTRCYEGY